MRVHSTWQPARRAFLAIPVALLVASCGALNDGTGPGLPSSMDAPPAAASEFWESPVQHSRNLCVSDIPPALGRLSWRHHVILEPDAPRWHDLRPAVPVPRCDASVTSKSPPEIVELILASIARVHHDINAAVVDLTGKAMPPVNVDLFPVYEDARHAPARFVTDNATYDRQTGTITLFPTRSPVGPYAKIWSSPFIHAHEIAHHAIKFLTHRDGDPATEEALADVIAFLATGANPALIHDLPGFGMDRDPTMPSFADGTRKTSVTISGTTSSTGWHDEHRRGAAKAFQILRNIDRQTDRQIAPQVRLRLVMAKFLSREI